MDLALILSWEPISTCRSTGDVKLHGDGLQFADRL
jgi:hypothetical protein